MRSARLAHSYTENRKLGDFDMTARECVALQDKAAFHCLLFPLKQVLVVFGKEAVIKVRLATLV